MYSYLRCTEMLDKTIPASKEPAPQSCSRQGEHGARAENKQLQTWARNRVYVAKKNALLYNTSFFSHPSACLLPSLLFLYISLHSFIFLPLCIIEGIVQQKKSSTHLTARASSLKGPAFEFWAQRSHYSAALSICHYMKCTLTRL